MWCISWQVLVQVLVVYQLAGSSVGFGGVSAGTGSSGAQVLVVHRF